MTQAWAVKGPDGQFIEGTMKVADSWEPSISAFMDMQDGFRTWGSFKDDGYDCVTITERAAEPSCEVALNVRHKDCHKAADAFWQYWRENGATHKHGYFESTWGAINQALRYVGVVPHTYSTPRIEVTRTSLLGEIDAMTSHQERSAEPVAWIRPDDLQKATKAPFLCRVSPTQTQPDYIRIFTAPSADDSRALLERAEQIIRRYRKETPLGHQPHMIALVAEELADDIKDHLARSGK